MTRALKIDRSMKRKHGHGGFGVEILHPGIPVGAGDSGVGAISRIDHARITPGTVVGMHPHRDDEILTYLRSGRVLHTDSEGHREEIGPDRLMLMNAGRGFQHEEHVLDEGDLQGLQIFIRPRECDLEPAVQFHAFEAVRSGNAWRLIAGPSNDAPLRFRAEAWVHDARLEAGRHLAIPVSPTGTGVRLLYVFEGRVSVEDIVLSDGEAVLLGDETPRIVAEVATDLVLFTTDPTAPSFANGMFSGNVLPE